MSDDPLAEVLATLSPEEQARLLTRRGVVEFANQRLGVPLKKSTLDKLSALGRGPVPDKHWGKVELFTPKTAAEWLRTLATDAPGQLKTG